MHFLTFFTSMIERAPYKFGMRPPAGLIRPCLVFWLEYEPTASSFDASCSASSSRATLRLTRHLNLLLSPISNDSII